MIQSTRSIFVSSTDKNNCDMKSKTKIPNYKISDEREVNNREFWLQLIQFKESISFELWRINFKDKNLNLLYETLLENIISINESNKN